ncbi:nuclear transport factor 2 family protein [Streptomyces luomodiensis]|uniref:Nuclear transport factor 2 family protein n=1 Tax=Streptomyces luomodiensis TaxID=3026192 RepID=A0ABY9V8C7_9ACTN|nr:nuclear transport factor 2 family protein [Streptomyces sp. SCA4-21]WNF01166.1 nuclear transport factor 2 family protein [Streptomyces sp. SCA4-21]
MSPTSALPTWLADALGSLAAGDLDGWMSIYAPDATHEFPWAAEGAVRRLEGRDAIAAYMSRLPEVIEFGPFTDVHVREAGDETIVQATGHHRSPDGTPRDLGYIWFITRRDGKVTRIQDYMNALPGSE